MAASGLTFCAQSTRPAPFPTPLSSMRKTDRTPPALTPIRTVWSLPLNNQLTASPAYDKLLAFFPIAGDRVAAYDLASGKQMWIASARPQLDPVAGDGLLFLIEPEALTALRVRDGGIGWQLPFADALAVHPVWDNGWLVAATQAGSILAFRATDGHLIWSRDLGSPAHAAPALAADRVYVPTNDNRVVALRVDTGAPIWERRLGGPPDEIFALEDRLYVGSKDNYFYSLMTKDGRVDWRWRTGGDVIGLPLADEHRVYFVALDNVLRALDRVSGGQEWMRPLPLRPSSGPVRAGSTIVVTGLAPALRAFNAADGVAAREIPAAPEVAAPPYVFDDPATGLPQLLYLTRDLATGATATLVTRSFEPEIAPVAPLPNLITFGPPTSTPTTPR
jgi:outer membrane protein assembly factor BamB